jgi:hypothetical protein
VVNIGQEGEEVDDRRSAWLDAVALIEADLDDDPEASEAILAATTDPAHWRLVAAYLAHIRTGAANGAGLATTLDHPAALRAIADVLAHDARRRIQAEHGEQAARILADLRRLALDDHDPDRTEPPA